MHARNPATRLDLTAQEEQIARLARDGRTNREIAGTLYLSTRTIEWHLRRVYAKLGITSRGQLYSAVGGTVLRAALARVHHGRDGRTGTGTVEGAQSRSRSAR